MIQFLKFVFIAMGAVVALVFFAVSCVILLFFPEWVRWVAGSVTFVLVGWFFLFGRFRRKSGLLINDGTVFDRWRKTTKVRGDFL